MPPPDARFRPLLERWGELWGVPDLPSRVTILPSARLRRSLGRCQPATGRISIRASLLDGDPRLLEEVLCHEAAHVAARVLAGPEARPHGAEWRELVRAAGFEPRVRRAGDAGGAGNAGGAGDASPSTPRRASGRFAYEHRCPVCQSVRYANTRRPRWRCLECDDAGLEGSLVIRRVAPSS
jgi:predicted SprT family Zn-dependent metalloprotease